MPRTTILPLDLHTAYAWTDAAGELEELRDLCGDDLDEYLFASALNYAEAQLDDPRQWPDDMGQDDLLRLRAWLQRNYT